MRTVLVLKENKGRKLRAVNQFDVTVNAKSKHKWNVIQLRSLKSG